MQTQTGSPAANHPERRRLAWLLSDGNSGAGYYSPELLEEALSNVAARDPNARILVDGVPLADRGAA